MKVLKFAILLLGCCSSCWLVASDVTFDLDRIKTENGRTYRDILILDSDQHGLLFRHAKGIAQLDYAQLSMNLRMLYEPVEEGPVEAQADPSEGDSLLSELGVIGKTADLTLTARNRVTVPFPSYTQHCAAYRRAWPMHWPRYHPVLPLAIPACRSAAIDDFLITTGLAPRPFGVTTYRLPYNRPYLLY